MTTRTHLLGIDPSFETMGVAIYHPKTGHLELYTGDFQQAIRFIGNAGMESIIAVVENPNLDKPVFKMWGLVEQSIKALIARKGNMKDVQSKFSVAMRYAQNVGQNKAAAKLIIKMLRQKGVPVIEVAPSKRQRADKEKNQRAELLRMPTKTSPEQFRRITGYTSRSSEHARDAATLVFGRTTKWAELHLARKASGATKAAF